jgi:hypothetical protein
LTFSVYPAYLAQASACAEGLTSVRWSRANGSQKLIPTEAEDNNRRFKQKTPKTLSVRSLPELCLGVLSSFASFACDQRTLVNKKASRRGVTPVAERCFTSHRLPLAQKFSFFARNTLSSPAPAAVSGLHLSVRRNFR